MLICGICTRQFWHWVKGHTNRVYRAGARDAKPKAFVSFYEAAGVKPAPARTFIEQLRVVTAEIAVTACRVRRSDEDYLWASVYDAAHHNHMLAYWQR